MLYQVKHIEVGNVEQEFLQSEDEDIHTILLNIASVLEAAPLIGSFETYKSESIVRNTVRWRLYLEGRGFILLEATCAYNSHAARFNVIIGNARPIDDQRIVSVIENIRGRSLVKGPSPVGDPH